MDFDLRLAPEGEVDPMSLSLRQFENEEQACVAFRVSSTLIQRFLSIVMHFLDIN